VLHLVVVTHGPETCPAVDDSAKRVASSGLKKLTDEQAGLGLSLVGGWANMPGHALYLIIEAANAHVINEALMGLGFHRWGTVNVSPVVDLAHLQEVLARPT
jgi:hypothetical protein